MEAKLSIFSKITIWALLLAPILQIYGFGSISISDIFIFSLILLSFVNRKKYKRLPKYLQQYFVYLVIATVLSCLFSINELIPRLLGVVRLFLVFSLLFSFFDFSYFYSSYKKLSILIIAVFFAQEISYRTFGVRVSGLIPFLPLLSNFANIEGSYTFQEHLSLISRSSSLFSEPAIMAQYLLPFFAITLFKEFGKKRLLFSGFSALSIILSMSGNGIIGLSCIIVMYSLYYIKNNNARSLTLIIPIILILISVGYVYLINNESVQKLSERAVELQSSGSSTELTSGFYRIYRGYYVYGEYNIIEKLTGVNNFTIIKERISQCPFAFTFENNDMYFNTIQNFLIKTGIIGLVLYLLLLVNLYKNNDYCSKSIIVTLLVLSFVANLYLSYLMILFLLVPYYTQKLYSKQ